MDIKSQIEHAYRDILNREMDADGFETYKMYMENHNKSIEWVKRILKQSDEYKSRFPKPVPSPIPKPVPSPIPKPVPSPIPKPVPESLELDKKVVNIFCCVRDNAFNLGKTLSYLRIIERQYKNIDFFYYVLENDSKDDTPFLVIDFFNSVKGRYRIERAEKKKHGTVTTLDRVQDMAKYRNMMKDLCKTWDNSEYSIILDTGVDFSVEIFHQMVDILKNDPKIVMVTPFGQVNGKTQFYDTFAFESKEGISKKLPKFTQRIERVNSAFSGFVVIQTPILQKCNWDVIDGNHSEHNAFCKQVRRYGDIVCATHIKVNWTP